MGIDLVDIGRPLSMDPQATTADGQFEVRPGEFYLTLLKRRTFFAGNVSQPNAKGGKDSQNHPKQVTTVSNPRFYEAFLHRSSLTAGD